LATASLDILSFSNIHVAAATQCRHRTFKTVRSHYLIAERPTPTRPP
jgi:hypothetical protein